MTDLIYRNEATIRLIVFASCFALLVLWEWFNPRRELTQSKFRRWVTNVALVVTSTVLVRFAVPTAAIGIAYLVEQKQWGLANYFDLPMSVKILITFVLLDLAIYSQHAMFHVLPTMWRFHRVHHSDLDCDVTTGLRFHPVEILFSILIKIMVIMLLGAPVLAVILFEIVLNVMSMFTHSNIHLNETFERMLRWIIVTPDMHRVHHSSRENETNSNFSFHISLWDRIFGTYTAAPAAGHQGMTIGLDQFRAPEWQSFKGLIYMPFVTRVRGYAINYRDTLNADELASVKHIVDEQTEYLKLAKEDAEQKNRELNDTVSRLAESESYQRMLVDNMVDGFITADTEGVIESFNSAAESIFGYAADEVIGRNVSILMPESVAINHGAYLARYMKKNDKRMIGRSREVDGRRKDGSIFPLDIALNDNEIGGKRIITAVVRDISERVRTKQQLEVQKEQLSNILENTDDAYLTLDKDWTVIYINSVSEALLGVNPDKVIGHDLRDALPDVVSMFYKMLRTTFTTQIAHEVTALYGPTMKYLEAHACPVKEGLVIYFRDITLRRKSEEDLRLARETEFRNSEKVRLATELTSYMKAVDEHALVSVADTKGKIIKANQKFCEMSGYSQEELLGKDHRIINSGTHPKAFFAEMWATITSGKVWHGEVCNRAKSGALYWVDSAIAPVKDAAGEIEHYISVRIEVTEHKRREEEINLAYQHLAEANDQLEQLSRVDSLTSLANRRHFDETLENEISRQSRLQTPLTLILCDIDYFKKYNDTYGHQAGDACLQKVARSIQSSFLRSSDLVARYGGEEFAVVLPHVDKDIALALAEKMRVNVQGLELEHDSSGISRVITLSVGVTTLVPVKHTTMAMLIEQADKSLYLAKAKGRNNVQCYVQTDLANCFDTRA